VKRIWRGLQALSYVFGTQFTIALVLVFGLLIWAVTEHHGITAGVLATICVLLAIRAHDLGDMTPDERDAAYWRNTAAGDDPSHTIVEARNRPASMYGLVNEPSEHTASYDPLAWEEDEIRRRAAEQRFQSERNAAALGKPHAPSEL
jgi:hypothetical protein